MLTTCQVPSQDGEAAAAELEYAVKKLGFVGCLINGFVNDANSPWDNLYLDSPKLRPFWKKVSELDGASDASAVNSRLRSARHFTDIPSSARLPPPAHARPGL